jgi:hypothetical protein
MPRRLGHRGVCALLAVGLVSSTFTAPAWSAEPSTPVSRTALSDQTAPNTDLQVTAGRVDSAKSDVDRNPRRTHKAKPGPSVGQVRGTLRGKKVTVPLRWNKKLLSKDGRKDRFSMRLVALRGEAQAPKALAYWPTKSIDRRRHKVTCRLGKSKAKKVRTASTLIVAGSQAQARNGHGRPVFHRGYVAHNQFAGHNTKCKHVMLRPDADLQSCTLIGHT